MSAPRPSATVDDSSSAAAPLVPWRRHVALAAAVYLVVALWALRPVLPLASVALPYPTALVALRGSWLKLSWNDQTLTAALLTQNARRITTAPWLLFDNGQCYPTSNSTALGEHMFGVGLRGVVPYALTRDPVLTTNIVLLSMLWLAGMVMYVLVAYWTGDPGAAFVAGLLFAFQPQRLTNVIHPYVEANDWTVIALLAAHLLFTRGRWIDAAMLAGAIALQTLESIYTVLALAVLGGIYGLYLSVRYWRRLPALVPKLLAVGGAASLVAAAVFAPYLHMREVWGDAVAGRNTLLYQLQDFGFGGKASPGTVTMLLAAIGVGERLWRRRDRRGYDPRLPLLVGGLLTIWLSVFSIPLPFGAPLPSLYTLAASVVPGLDSIRAGAAIGRGVPLIATFLAGYGVLVLVERRAALTRALLTGAIAAVALVEVFVPARATRDFGAPVTMAAHEVRPAADLLALYDRLPAGPVLDVPFDYSGAGILRYMPHYVFLAAYHHRPIGACYESFVVQVQQDLATLVSRLPDHGAVDALAALGFRSLVVHGEMLGRHDPHLGPLAGDAAVAHPPDPELTHLVLLDHVAGHSAYLLEYEVATTTSYTALAIDTTHTTNEPPTAVMTAKPPRVDVFFTFRNGAAATYHHPPPIEPTSLLLRWYSTSGALVREDRVREMLPLALAPAQTMVRKIAVPIAVGPGEYQLTLSPGDAPDLVLSGVRLDVVAPAAHS